VGDVVGAGGEWGHWGRCRRVGGRSGWRQPFCVWVVGVGVGGSVGACWSFVPDANSDLEVLFVLFR